MTPQRQLKKQLQSLTPQQVSVIYNALEGKNWRTISSELGIAPSTIWKWRQEPAFKQILLLCQENMFAEISSKVSVGLNNAFARLDEHIKNNNFEDSKSKTEAIKVFWELCLKTADYSKVIEDNRRLLNIEDFGSPLGVDYFKEIDPEQIEVIDSKKDATRS